MAAGDLHGQRLGLEPVALAGGAGLLRLVARQVLAHPGVVGLAVAPLEVGQHALEGLLHGVGAQPVLVAERHHLVAGAVQDAVPHPLRQLAPGRRGRDLVVLRQAVERLVVIGRGGAGPGRDGALLDGAEVVRHHQHGVEEGLGAEPVAGRAGALRAVEGEEPRLDLLDGEAADRAGELGAEHRALAAVGVLRVGDAVGQRQRGLEAVGEARRDAVAHHHAVHHHLDVVLQLLVELRRLGDQVQRAVHLHPLEAAALELGELLAELALLAARDRGEQQQPRALRHGQHPVHHLADRLRLDRQAGGGRVGHADARPEQAHVVVDLGDGADRGARIVGGGLLLDGDGGREPLDRVHVRLLHELQELPGIGRERLDVAPLPLGVDRVEGERGLARSRTGR